LAAIETAEMIGRDAMRGHPPELVAVLTTRAADPDPRSFYRAREHVLRALRRRFSPLEAATLVEFTTGYAEKSGGLRRPHWNLLLKGPRVEDVDQVRELVLRVWCDRVDAEERGQYVEPIRSHGGLARYVALHFLKESQQPPKGWRGHRFTATRGYFPQGTKAARAEAREQLQAKRELWKVEKAVEEQGIRLFPDEVLELAEAAVARRRARSFEVVSFGKDKEDGHVAEQHRRDFKEGMRNEQARKRRATEARS
jgi:hypothetical protein